jgi:glycerol-3-phosphate dehydrogenase
MRHSGTYDLLIVGGGINGVGIARDAAGRGLSVLLCEQDDLAAHTSSASTKLIHGGLRYLEHMQFSLVRKALIEREILLASAPHLMRPLRFVLPHDAHLRPVWMIAAGLFIYDHLARRRHLAGSARIDLRRHVAGAALKPQYTRGFVYSDGWTDDARLVVLNAVDARERGAEILTRTRCEKLESARGKWAATLAAASGRQRVMARAVVNATGPWVSSFAHAASPASVCHSVRLVKGSHIVVPRLFAHRFAYLFQNEDQRIVFAIPYQREFTLIGTTDVEYTGDPAAVHIDAEEIRYLCAAVSRYFAKPVSPEDVVWSYSGVRPLLDDESKNPASVTRDYALELDREPAPLLTVFGGKITTYRKLAESAVDMLSRELGSAAPPWTAHALLPGGDLPGGAYGVFLRNLQRAHPWLPTELTYRYAHAYGTRVTHILHGARSLADLGEELLPQLYEREVDYLCRVELARTAEDILWRRTRLGLHVKADGLALLQEWLARHGLPASAQATAPTPDPTPDPTGRRLTSAG